MNYTLLHILSEARILYTAIKNFGVNYYYRLRAYAFSVISNDKNKSTWKYTQNNIQKLVMVYSISKMRNTHGESMIDRMV